MMYGKKGPGDPKKKKKKATRSMVSKLPMSVGSNLGYLDSLFNETGPKSRKAKETLTKLPGRKVSKPKK